MIAWKAARQRLGLTLAPRLIGLVMLSTVATGTLLGVLLIQNCRTVVRDDLLEKNLVIADLIAKFAANYIEGAQTNVRQFAARPLLLRAVLEHDLSSAGMHLMQFMEIDPRFDVLTVYDAQGQAWASVLGKEWSTQGGVVADQEWFQQVAASKRPHLGIPIMSQSTGHPIAPFAVPILDDKGEIHSVIMGGISLRMLSGTVGGFGTSTLTRASLMDARQGGFIIAHADPQRILKPVTGQNTAALRAISGERGTMETPDTRGELTFAAFSPVPGLPWAVLMLEPVETGLEPVNRLTITAVFCLTVVMLIAVFLGIWMVRKITRPVQELVVGTEEIAKGNLEWHIPVRSQDEIGRLADAFNTMTISLKQSQRARELMEEALRAERDTLEQRVIERTQTLQDSEHRLALLGCLQQELIGAEDLSIKLKCITDGIVAIFGADFARIWMIKEADLCDNGCYHTAIEETPCVCHDRRHCLHLMASSGRYTHLDGNHRRVPLGCYKIGCVATGEIPQFITNDVTRDPRVHDRAWASRLGLVSFAGFRLLSAQGRPIGVMALFSQHPIQPQDEVHLNGLASTASQVILEGEAKEALKKSEEKYRHLFDNAQTGMFRTRVDGSAMLDINQKFADIFGYSMAELMALPPRDLWLTPEARDEVVNQLREEGAVTDYEMNVRDRSGETKTCLASFRFYPLEGCLEGTAVDITERRRGAAALHHANQMFQVVLDNTPQRVFWKDRQLRYLGCNKYFASDAGYADPAELIGKDDYAMPWKESVERYRDDDESVMASDTPKLDYEEAQIRPDGRLWWLRTNKVPLHDSQGTVIGMLGTYEDITERKAAAAALNREKQRLERASAIGKVALFECDLATGVLEWSGVIDSMLGFGKGEFPRTVEAWHGILHPDERIDVLETLQQHLPDDEPYTMEYRVRRADGTYLWWHAVGSTQRDADGRPIRITGACVDITARKLAEEERLVLERKLLQAQKAESLGRMAGAIAHHFNNKLGAVIGNLELALISLPPESKTRKYLAGAMTASHQSVDISRLMLAYLGQTVGERELLDLAQTVREALVLLAALLPEKIRLGARSLPAQGPTILADNAQITLILNNLVTNAMEAIGDREGDITLAVDVKPALEIRKLEYLRMDWEPTAEEYACLSVADTGCGIDAGVHDRVFDPFYSTKFTGRGLGLAVVHGIVKAHQGAIAVESEAGQGATFYVFFPCRKGE